MTYDSDNFKRYLNIDSSQKGDGIVRQSTITSDALVVSEKGHALFLPLADCAGVVIYSEVDQILMLSHIGRHSVEQSGAIESINFLKQSKNISPKNLKVYITPSAGKDSYPLFKFDNQSLQEVIIKQLIDSGVPKENITSSLIDTTRDDNYYSHSQYIKCEQTDDGRFAIAAIIK